MLEFKTSALAQHLFILLTTGLFASYATSVRYEVSRKAALKAPNRFLVGGMAFSICAMGGAEFQLDCESAHTGISMLLQLSQ